MESRDFRDGDLRPLLELAQELWRADPTSLSCTFGQIAFWSANIPHGEPRVRLWYDGDELAGWGWVTGDTELECQVRPERPELLWMRINRRGLGEIEEPSLPEGYRVRTVDDGDFESRAAAHRSAFHPSRFRDEVYANVRASWPYRQDLDCVVEAPGGSIAAYALAWLDEVNAIGELGPVGTHTDHQQRGLGRAVNLFALQRLREEGATLALVACRGDDDYPIPVPAQRIGRLPRAEPHAAVRQAVTLEPRSNEVRTTFVWMVRHNTRVRVGSGACSRPAHNPRTTLERGSNEVRGSAAR